MRRARIGVEQKSVRLTNDRSEGTKMNIHSLDLRKPYSLKSHTFKMLGRQSSSGS